LINLAIVAGALATVLTASPALGGLSFSDWLNETFGFTSPAWQVLCAGAAICSLAAAISTQMLKSHNIEEHVARAEAVRAKLEALDLGRITRAADTGAGGYRIQRVRRAGLVPLII
jgi:uncharacterized membrane protein YozB (DUF420 family)